MQIFEFFFAKLGNLQVLTHYYFLPTVPHQVGFQRITSAQFEGEEDHILDRPEKLIELNGHIVGMAISPNQDLLYVNVRSWPENCKPETLSEPPCISNQIEMKIINLHTFQLSEPSFIGNYTVYQEN